METAEESELIGRTIAGKFKIESRVGSGAMGVVYRARQLALEKDVAVKVLHPALAYQGFAERFHREALAASRLDHPNSIHVIDFGEEPDGLLYIVMEFAPGRDLQAVAVEEGPLDDARIVNILSQALAALAVAHDTGVVHRDLKPENILILSGVDDDGHPTDVVKVCDFGLARIVDPRSDRDGANAKAYTTSTGIVMGTPEYMAPEQARGLAIDARTDIYSMGVVLYRLLAGAVPFEAGSAMGVAVQHIYEEPEKPSKIARRRLNTHLEAVCLKALKKIPAERYQTAREMRADLRTALDPGGLPSSGPVRLIVIDPSRPADAATIEDARRAPTLTAVPPTLTTPTSGALEARPPEPWSRARRVSAGAALGAVICATAAAATLGPRRTPPATPAMHTERAAPPLDPPLAHTARVVTPDAPLPNESAAPAPPDTARPPASAEPRSTAPVVLQVPRLPPATAAAPSEQPPAPVASPPPLPQPAPVPVVETASPAPSPAPPPAVAAPPPPTAAPVVDIEAARVVISGISTSNALSVGSVRSALNHAPFTRCYKDALRAGGAGAGGTVRLRLAIDDTGHVTSASAAGIGFLPSAKACVEAAARSVRISNVDTGDAMADVTLTFSPR
jgi:serine/threonine-protein kinase